MAVMQQLRRRFARYPSLRIVHSTGRAARRRAKAFSDDRIAISSGSTSRIRRAGSRIHRAALAISSGAPRASAAQARASAAPPPLPMPRRCREAAHFSQARASAAQHPRFHREHLAHPPRRLAHPPRGRKAERQRLDPIDFPPPRAQHRRAPSSHVPHLPSIESFSQI